MFSTPKNQASQGLTHGWDQERLSRLVKTVVFRFFPDPGRWNEFTVKSLPNFTNVINNSKRKSVLR